MLLGHELRGLRGHVLLFSYGFLGFLGHDLLVFLGQRSH